MDSQIPDPQNTPEEESTQRASRARERQRRRLERRERQKQATPRGTGHLLASDRPQIKLPRIQIPGLRWFAGLILGAVLIVGIILILGRLKPPDAVDYPHALWIGTEWTYAEHEPEAIDALANQLRAHKIGTVYAWVSWLQEDATWRGADNFGAVQQFATQLKASYPELKLYGWISFPVNLDTEDGYRLDDEELQQSIADFSASVVSEWDYDGVFLNIEPVWNGDENFLALLRRVRAALGEDIPVAVAIPPDWSPLDADIPVPPLIVPGTIWETTYKQSVALLCNQMVVMAYNSGLSDPADYVQWMAYQVEAYAAAISELGEGTHIVIGIPTYDAEPPGHDPLVENMETALQGYTAGLQQAGNAAAFVHGLAIYAGWTTDETEWAVFANWLAGT